MVVMSLARYEYLQGMLELYQKLAEAEIVDAAGEQGISHQEMIKQFHRPCIDKKNVNKT